MILCNWHVNIRIHVGRDTSFTRHPRRSHIELRRPKFLGISCPHRIFRALMIFCPVTLRRPSDSSDSFMPRMVEYGLTKRP